MTRREFLFSSVACGAVGHTVAEEEVSPELRGRGRPLPMVETAGEEATPPPQTGIRIRFLGSGASGWKPEWATEKPFMRRQTSAYITHLGVRYRNWPSEKIDAELPDGIKSAFDGLELVLG